MKKLIFLFICVATCFMFSCKKDANNRIANVKYELDSVRIEELNANDSSLGFNTFPLRSSFIDSVIGDKHNPQDLYFSPGFYTNGDSLIYVNHPEFFDTYKYVVVNKTPISNLNFNPSGSFAQYGYHKIESFYNYQNNQLNNFIIIDHDHTAAPYTGDFYIEMNNNFIYTNNNLYSIINKRLDYSYDEYFNINFDSVIHPDLNLADFSYTSNIPNQKDLMSVDLNDLILNKIIGPNNYLVMYYSQLFILGNRVSYYTNCSYLIEKLRFMNIGYINTESNFTIRYTFDADKNNRITTMKIKDDLAGSTLYTFYYKN